MFCTPQNHIQGLLTIQGLRRCHRRPVGLFHTLNQPLKKSDALVVTLVPLGSELADLDAVAELRVHVREIRELMQANRE